MRGMRCTGVCVGAMTTVGAGAVEYDRCAVGLGLGGSPGAALLEDSSLCPRLWTGRPSACEAGLGCAEDRLEAEGTGKNAMRRMAEAARMRSGLEPILD